MIALGSSRAASMSSGLLLDPMPAPTAESSAAAAANADAGTGGPANPAGGGPRFMPYAGSRHHVTKGRYITSNDPRGYIPVHEYPLNGQWIMLDMDDGYVLWTGIWKALGNSKADIVKIIESQPDIAPQLRRVRGGYLKIQGTWMPYETALRLARIVAWPIRYDLIPVFGPTFPSTCLPPDHPEFGQIVKPGSGKRRARRAAQPTQPPAAASSPASSSSRHDWAVPPASAALASPPSPASPAFRHAQGLYPLQRQVGSPVMLHAPYPPEPREWSGHAHGHRHGHEYEYDGYAHAHRPQTRSPPARYSPYPSPLSAHSPSSAAAYAPYAPYPPPPARPPSAAYSPSATAAAAAYSPYPSPASAPDPERPRHSHSHAHSHSLGNDPLRRTPERARIHLPALQPQAAGAGAGAGGGGRRGSLTLPPISALAAAPGPASVDDSRAVLRRLRADEDVPVSGYAQSQGQGRSQSGSGSETFYSRPSASLPSPRSSLSSDSASTSTSASAASSPPAPPSPPRDPYRAPPPGYERGAPDMPVWLRAREADAGPGGLADVREEAAKHAWRPW